MRRVLEYLGSPHDYNHHRPHTACHNRPPATRIPSHVASVNDLTHLAQDVGGVDDAAAQGQQHELDPVAAAGLGQQVAHVGLDRGHGQPLPVADLLVGQAQGDER